MVPEAAIDTVLIAALKEGLGDTESKTVEQFGYFFVMEMRHFLKVQS